jgi:hypothetical protein
VIAESIDLIYLRVSSAAWSRSQWWHEGPEFLHWYWALRSRADEEINR